MLVRCWWRAHGRRAKRQDHCVAFFLRVRAGRGHLVAAVAVARKLAVSIFCWHLLTKNVDYQLARPALVAQKVRAMELQAGQPAKKGNRHSGFDLRIPQRQRVTRPGSNRGKSVGAIANQACRI